MAFSYLLLILLPIVVVAYVVWDYRRKTAARMAASSGRLNELLGVVAQTQQRVLTPVEAVLTPSLPTPRPEAPPAAPLYASRERVLNPQHTLLYYLLKTGLPDHVVFARVTLASILEAGPGLSGVARDEQTRRLAAITVDFVVADKGMRPVAVVELASNEQGSAALADRASARTRLAAAGVRYVELDARTLPRKDAMRSLVLNEAGASAAAAAPGTAN